MPRPTAPLRSPCGWSASNMTGTSWSWAAMRRRARRARRASRACCQRSRSWRLRPAARTSTTRCASGQRRRIAGSEGRSDKVRSESGHSGQSLAILARHTRWPRWRGGRKLLADAKQLPGRAVPTRSPVGADKCTIERSPGADSPAQACNSHRRRQPERTALCQIMRDRWPGVLATCREAGDGQDLPAFIDRAFEQHLS